MSHLKKVGPRKERSDNKFLKISRDFIFIINSIVFFLLVFSIPSYPKEEQPTVILISASSTQEFKTSEQIILVPSDVKWHPFPAYYVLWNTWWRNWAIEDRFGFGFTLHSLLNGVPFQASKSAYEKWQPLPKSEIRARKLKWIEKTKDDVEDKLDQSKVSFLNYGVRFSWSGYLYFRDWNKEFKTRHHLYPKLRIPFGWKTLLGKGDISNVSAEITYRWSFDDFSSLVYSLAGTKKLGRADYWIFWKRFSEVGAVKHTLWIPFRQIPVLKQIDAWTPIEYLGYWFEPSSSKDD